MPIAINTTPKVLTRLQIELDYSGNQLIYVGEGSDGLSTSSNGWLVNKLNYSGNQLASVSTSIGAWDNRISLVYS